MRGGEQRVELAGIDAEGRPGRRSAHRIAPLQAVERIGLFGHQGGELHHMGQIGGRPLTVVALLHLQTVEDGLRHVEHVQHRHADGVVVLVHQRPEAVDVGLHCRVLGGAREQEELADMGHHAGQQRGIGVGGAGLARQREAP